MTAPEATEQWQKRPEAGGRFAIWLWRTLAFKVGRPVVRFITFFAALYFMIRRGPEGLGYWPLEAAEPLVTKVDKEGKG